MKTDLNGCSTCATGAENYEFFTAAIGRKKIRSVQYDYRTPDGKLFSTVAASIDEARKQRDQWLTK